MHPNKLRELLRPSQPTLGTHVHSAWPATIEILFDWFKREGDAMRKIREGR